MSVYLEAAIKFPEQKLFGKFGIRIVNQCGGKDMQLQSIGCCFSKTSPRKGWSAFLLLADLHDASKGFLVNDTLIIQAEVDVFSTIRSFLNTSGTAELPPAKVLSEGLTEIIVQDFSGTVDVPALNAEREIRSMPEKINRHIAIDYGDSKVARSLRDKPPGHFTLKIDSFSSLYKIVVNDTQAGSFESEVFEAGGYKWKLSLYPYGDKRNKGVGYISLYLVIVDTHDLPRGWKVSANLKFFLYDQLQNKYLTIQDANAAASRFDAKKTCFGFARLLPYSSFSYAGNGYLVNDKCIFGVEVVVKDYIGTGCTVESLAMAKALCTWKIDKFSFLRFRYYPSTVFTVGNCKWKLVLYPKGDSRAKNNTLSVYLESQDFEAFPEQKTFSRFEFRIVNQRGGKDMQLQSRGCCFSKTSPSWGYRALLPLADLHDPSKGFLVNDTLIIQAQVDLFSGIVSRTIDHPDLDARQLLQTKVQNQGSEKITVINLSGTLFDTTAAKTTTTRTRLPQAKVKKEGSTQNNSSKKSGTEAPKEIQLLKPWFKRWFF